MKMENGEFVEVDPEGYMMPFHMKFIASTLPYKLNVYDKLPLHQPLSMEMMIGG